MRAWRAPVRHHLVVLALLLVALLPLIGTGASFSADEGAAIVQARSLAEGGGWVVEHPAPELDPDSRHYPLELSERGRDGAAPFGKHPLYALLLAGALRAGSRVGVGGVTAMVALSLAGTVASAALAAALARRLGSPALARPALWAVGGASPLLFDGYLVMAHTLGAATAAATVLAAMVAVERRSMPLAVVAVPAGVAVSVLLRSEALFLALGLAVAAVVATRRTAWRAHGLAVAAASLTAGVVARMGERLWAGHLVGGGVGVAAVPAQPTEAGIVSDRVFGFVVTWVAPTYSGRVLVGLSLSAMVVAIAWGAWTVRARPEREGTVVVCSLVAAACSVAALRAGPANVVPGLLVAFPLVVAGLVLLGGAAVAGTGARLASVTTGVFVVAVLATQYSTGGSGEWGGRYFALVIPVAVPILLAGLARHRHRLPGRVAARAAAALVVCSLAMAGMSVGSIAEAHRVTSDLVTTVDRAHATAGTPVIVTTSPSLPRFAWSTFDRQRWLLARRGDLRPLARTLDSFTFVTADLAGDHALLGDRYLRRLAGADDGSGWQVLQVGVPAGRVGV